MNNQKPETPNQNWRPHNYIQEPRSHNVSRPENFYSHYPTPQFINDYMHTGYVYPGVLPSYRSGQAPMPPSNSQIVNPLTMLSPEDYAKYYNKIQNYIPPDPRICIKNYPPHQSFYDHPHPYRTSHYHPMGLQNQNPSQPNGSPVFPHQPYPSSHLSKIDKNNKNKSIIVIESDEENGASSDQIKKLLLQKKQEKLPIQFVEFEEKRHSSKSQEIQQEKNETLVKILPPTFVNNSKKQVIHVIQKQQQKKQIVLSPLFQKQPNKQIVYKENAQIVPIQIIEKLRDEILQQLETAELPDGTMKIFLTYKTLETHSQYLENQEISIKVLNLLKIYRAIIQFQKQRKYFIEHIVGDQIFKKFNYAPKNKILPYPLLESKQKINQIAEQINQNIQYNSKINGNRFTNAQQESNVNKQKQISNSFYPQKTKKINKKQLHDQNSEQISFKSKLTEKDPSQLNPNVICERRLRDRKKKKSKRQKYQKSYSQKYLKDVQKQQKQKVQSSKAEKLPVSKQNVKGDVQFSQQEELIQKIQGWAERTALAYAIQQKHKKGVKNPTNQEHTNKPDSSKTNKKDESFIQNKKYKQRSTKASENQFRLMVLKKIEQQKTKQEIKPPNLMTFVTSNNLTEIEKDEFQKQMTHLTKELKNNENHGKIRIGKEYYQAKMPNFIQSQTELALMMKQKRQKLMERKMSVLTF